MKATKGSVTNFEKLAVRRGGWSAHSLSMNTGCPADVLLSFVPPDILRSACAMLRCMGLYMKDRPDYYIVTYGAI